MRSLFNNVFIDENNIPFFRFYNLEGYLEWQGSILAKIVNESFLVSLKENSFKENFVRSFSNMKSFIVPIGDGLLGCIIAKSFAEYNKFPRFIGVQIKGIDSITKAWEEKKFTTNPLKQTRNGILTLAWLENNNGIMLSVSDENILEAQKLLVQCENVQLNRLASTVIAALKIGIPKINKDQNILLILPDETIKEI